MEFQWDALKSASNEKKHGFDFDLAKEVFEDPLHKAIPVFGGGEPRSKVIGLIEKVACVVVIHTNRTENGTEFCRIISARKASRKERNEYDCNSKKPT